ncbi:MAG: hypothetical protein LBB08_01675 [Rickettsiales bacterium]|jgi:hypothetical protein|nr:hypothetical protein [Rickettsiales bacterium]
MKKHEEIIISLTSFPARIGTVAEAIGSILSGWRLPDKIVLYLAEPQFPGRRLPAGLASLPLLEIRWEKNDMRSYKKLVPALRDFPDATIITIDDDLIYPRDLVSRLLACHKRYPNAVCARRARRAQSARTAEWKLYRWARCILWGMRPRLNNIGTSGGGILFPPRSLYGDISKSDIFMSIAPTTDDLWWWAMAVMNGTKTAVASRSLHLEYIPGSQSEALWRINCGQSDENQKAFDRICQKYPIKEKLGLA